MRIAIIGARGQLGTDLVERLKAAGEHELLELSGPNNPKPGDEVCDVTDRDGLFGILKPFKPERIFNCSAFNQVDLCEDEVVSAYSVNHLGVVNLGELALDCGIELARERGAGPDREFNAELIRECGPELVHFSTDYVFDGKKDTPYLEDDAPNPLSVYGASKLAGEIVLGRMCEKHYIFRVSGLYGVAGSSGKGGNFVETMIRIGKEKGAVRVVDDQRLAPTFTADLAEKVLEVVGSADYGLYHLAASEDCSWFEFAKEIFRLCKIKVKCKPQSTAKAGRKANRPAYSVLASSKLEKLGIAPIRSWREGLAEYLRRKGHIPG